MSKGYSLMGGTTYATLKAVFKAGEVYSAEEVGALATATTETGEALFEEVELDEHGTVAAADQDGDEAPAEQKKSVTIGKRAGVKIAGDDSKDVVTVQV